MRLFFSLTFLSLLVFTQPLLAADREFDSVTKGKQVREFPIFYLNADEVGAFIKSLDEKALVMWDESDNTVIFKAPPEEQEFLARILSAYDVRDSRDEGSKSLVVYKPKNRSFAQIQKQVPRIVGLDLFEASNFGSPKELRIVLVGMRKSVDKALKFIRLSDVP